MGSGTNEAKSKKIWRSEVKRLKVLIIEVPLIESMKANSANSRPTGVTGELADVKDLGMLNMTIKKEKVVSRWATSFLKASHRWTKHVGAEAGDGGNTRMGEPKEGRWRGRLARWRNSRSRYAGLRRSWSGNVTGRGPSRRSGGHYEGLIQVKILCCRWASSTPQGVS